VKNVRNSSNWLAKTNPRHLAHTAGRLAYCPVKEVRRSGTRCGVTGCRLLHPCVLLLQLCADAGVQLDDWRKLHRPEQCNECRGEDWHWICGRPSWQDQHTLRNDLHQCGGVSRALAPINIRSTE